MSEENKVEVEEIVEAAVEETVAAPVVEPEVQAEPEVVAVAPVVEAPVVEPVVVVEEAPVVEAVEATSTGEAEAAAREGRGSMYAVLSPETGARVKV